MDTEQRDFLEALLTTPTPSGFERAGQGTWLDYVEPFADELRTDAYGNAVAVHHGSDDVDLELAFAGHADEIGLMVRNITEDGFIQLTGVGGADKTVTRGQQVTVHADEPISGVIGQTAIHLRDRTNGEDVDDIANQHVDIGVDSKEDAEELVEIGDPITIDTSITTLSETRLTARGMDNRIGVWAAAEALRRAVERDADATIYAIATVQEEVGLKGAQMVGFDIAPDAYFVVDVTHATDTPAVPGEASTAVTIGDGPVVARGSTNHPALVERLRSVADDESIDIQLQAAGSRTGTDADAFYTSNGGAPAVNVGLPNRYMHTPVELIDTDDLEDVAALLGAVGGETDTLVTDLLTNN
ncbi:M20/M25/M40 family metallo-hydrolase [Halocatena halophila]|uniref:M20/M25/M40 family metallo-hydrolase n=1 Tax=Halocatena halophila TaxID=2814576 RepID=UPI002ED16170